VPDGLGVVVVTDTLRALQDLAAHARSVWTGPVVAITGSSGKTTTRALTALALSGLGPIHQTKGNLNNHIGLPLSLLAGSADAAATVVELGTSSPGEILRLAEISRPDVRLVLNVGPAHLEELGGLEGVSREKCALARTAGEGDVVVLPSDDPWIDPACSPSHARLVLFGGDAAADVRVIKAEVASDGSTRVEVVVGGNTHTMRLGVPGVHMATDAAAALAISTALGVDPSDAVSRMEAYEPVGMRGRIERLPGGAFALNDAYNANPASMEAALTSLAALPGRHVAVLGDMLELGAGSAAWHGRVLESASDLGLDAVILLGPRMAAARDQYTGEGEVVLDPAGENAVAFLKNWLREGDHVLFKGSRGAAVERILLQLQAVQEDA
jgi:UDP-N-acetylmuramoyl-tripeptide--D-alanyl-D-alanine ligase